MTKTIQILLVVSTMLTSNSFTKVIDFDSVTESSKIQDNYCDGWEDGYKAGWCYEVVGCVDPIVPVCPVPTVNCNSGYKCGYNRGFKAGMKAANND